MSKVQEFIDLVGQGQNSQAQEALNDILSAKAFEALDSFKQSVGANLFATEEVVEEEAEQLDEISRKTATNAFAARVDRFNNASDDNEIDKHADKASKTARHIGARYGSTGLNKAYHKAGHFDLPPGHYDKAVRDTHADMKNQMAKK